MIRKAGVLDIGETLRLNGRNAWIRMPRHLGMLAAYCLVRPGGGTKHACGGLERSHHVRRMALIFVMRGSAMLLAHAAMYAIETGRTPRHAGSTGRRSAGPYVTGFGTVQMYPSPGMII